MEGRLDDFEFIPLKDSFYENELIEYKIKAKKGITFENLKVTFVTLIGQTQRQFLMSDFKGVQLYATERIHEDFGEFETLQVDVQLSSKSKKSKNYIVTIKKLLELKIQSTYLRFKQSLMKVRLKTHEKIRLISLNLHIKDTTIAISPENINIVLLKDEIFQEVAIVTLNADFIDENDRKDIFLSIAYILLLPGLIEEESPNSVLSKPEINSKYRFDDSDGDDDDQPPPKQVANKQKVINYYSTIGLNQNGLKALKELNIQSIPLSSLYRPKIELKTGLFLKFQLIDSVVLQKIFYVEVLCINYSGSDIDLEINEMKTRSHIDTDSFLIHDNERPTVPGGPRRTDTLKTPETNVLSDSAMKQSFSMNQTNSPTLDRASQLKQGPKSKLSIFHGSQSRTSIKESPNIILESRNSITASIVKVDHLFNKRNVDCLQGFKGVVQNGKTRVARIPFVILKGGFGLLYFEVKVNGGVLKVDPLKVYVGDDY